MILTNNIYGNFKGNDFIIGSTNSNEYFPVYITFEEKRNSNYYYYEDDFENRLSELVLSNDTNNVYLYRKPERVKLHHNNLYDDYSSLFKSLERDTALGKYMFTYHDVQYHIGVMKGYLVDVNDNILMMLTTNKYDIFDGDNLKKEHLKLYVSTELIRNEIYTNFYKRLYKDYITLFYNEDIDVIFTTSSKIEEAVFKNDFRIEYDNLTQLNEILNILPYEIINHQEEQVEEELPF